MKVVVHLENPGGIEPYNRFSIVQSLRPSVMHRVTYFHETTVENVSDGRTLLDVSIGQRIPHLHQCGARGRCTTCRIQILDGVSHLSARSPIVEEVASKR